MFILSEKYKNLLIYFFHMVTAGFMSVHESCASCCLFLITHSLRCWLLVSDWLSLMCVFSSHLWSHLNSVHSCRLQINTFARMASIRRSVSSAVIRPLHLLQRFFTGVHKPFLYLDLFWVKNTASCSTVDVPHLMFLCRNEKNIYFFCFTSHMPPDFPQTPTTSSSYLLCLICLAACSGKLPAVSVYI